MSGGEIKDNGAAGSAFGGGVYVNGGSFAMSGAAKVNPNNPVYLHDGSKFIGIADAFTPGTDPVALVQPAPDIGFIGEAFVKLLDGISPPLPADRFTVTSGWTADPVTGILGADALDLDYAGETLSAYLSPGSVHFYRFTPVLSAQYSVTRTGAGGNAAAWADGQAGTDGKGTLASGGTIFNALRDNVDIIIMVYNGEGAYTVKYNQHL
jgi:hypothetical protein